MWAVRTSFFWPMSRRFAARWSSDQQFGVLVKRLGTSQEAKSFAEEVFVLVGPSSNDFFCDPKSVCLCSWFPWLALRYLQNGAHMCNTICILFISVYTLHLHLYLNKGIQVLTFVRCLKSGHLWLLRRSSSILCGSGWMTPVEALGTSSGSLKCQKWSSERAGKWKISKAKKSTSR